jgi:hypothetical protein
VYIESKFLVGMSWDNHGRGENSWSIDHIKPLFSFKLNLAKDQREACHFTNLMPLWHIDNMRKQDRYPYTLPACHIVPPWLRESADAVAAST